MTISDTDLAQIEVTAGLTLQLTATIRALREELALRHGEIAREVHEARQARERLLVAVRELEAANARIRELEAWRDTNEIDAAADASEMETLRGKYLALLKDADTVLHRAGPAVDEAARRIKAVGYENARALAQFEPATVKP
jgi:hypothetical protein